MRLGRTWGVIFGLIALLILPETSMAGKSTEGAKAAAMGGAFVAVADDPSAIAHNPAGLINLTGTNVYNGFSLETVSSEYNSPEGQSETTSFRMYFPPHAYLTSDFGCKNLAFGLGIYSPFGIGGRNWSEFGLTRYASTQDLTATVNFNPTVAWRVLPQLSLGVGVDILYSLEQFSRMVNQSIFAFRDAKLSFRGSGTGVGGNFGMLLFPEGKFSLAFAYRSEIRLKERGSLALEAIAPPLQPHFGGGVFRTDASTVMHFPSILAWGAAYRPTPQVTLSWEIDWFLWSVDHKASLNLRTEVPAVKFTNLPVTYDWRNSLLIMTGIDYKISNRFSFRGGYAYQQSRVPEQSLDPGDPDADEHIFSMGLGYRKGNWVIDAFYAIGFYVDRSVNNAILSGTYHSLANSGGVTIGHRF
jgi:long-chain fatty acid transport protein